MSNHIQRKSRPVQSMFLVCNAVILLMFGGCNTHPTPPLPPLTAKWSFACGMGDWQTPYAEDVQITKESNVPYLRLIQSKNNIFGGRIHKTLNVSQLHISKATMIVVARASTSLVPVSIGISCHTDKQEGPTYGCLKSHCIDFIPTLDWATYNVILKIPKGTKNIGFMVQIKGPESVDSSLDIRSIEYLIE